MRPTVSSGSKGMPLWVPLIEPSLRSMNDDVFFLAVLFFGGGDERGFDPSKTTSLSMFLSRWIASTIRKISFGFINHFPFVRSSN